MGSDPTGFFSYKQKEKEKREREETKDAWELDIKRRKMEGKRYVPIICYIKPYFFISDQWT